MKARFTALLHAGLLLAISVFPVGAATYGPYHGFFLPDGLGLKKSFAAPNPPVQANAAWSMYCWVRSEEAYPPKTLVAGFGDPDGAVRTQRFLVLSAGRLGFWAGSTLLVGGPVLAPDAWHQLAATYDGVTVRLYADGVEAAASVLNLNEAVPLIHLAPQPPPEGTHYAGRIAGFQVVNRALAAAELRALHAEAAGLDLLPFEAASRAWPVPLKAHAGLVAPQDPSSLPHSTGPAAPASARAVQATQSLSVRGPGRWALSGGWQLAEAPGVQATAAQLSSPAFKATGWWPATVPGTVLTTLIDRGVYPDPDFGLNNLAIPERLSRQDYWYRAEFTPPAELAGRRLSLSFQGINYAAAVWVNGKQVGSIKGAFIRGVFDVTGLVVPGRPNAVAVRISPPPHPGIPHEQSMLAGPGPNGGIQLIDGPTFFCTEGWDWIPGIRDRNSGLWQEVLLSATGAVGLGDPHVITTLPLPETSRARVEIRVPLRNASASPVPGTLVAAFEGVRIEKQLSLPPGETVVRLTPEEFPALALSKPRLWWPNGYGKPELYHLTLTFSGPLGDSDQTSIRFGIREISYELTLLDAGGRLRRVEYMPAASPGEPLVDVSHEGMRETVESWVASLRPGAERSPAIRALPQQDRATSPMLVLRVNGVRIALKGGNWGISDSRKRVSRERLEPFVRLTRDANLTMIRNWCGQSTEEALFELCDEYGILVWNDFWSSTQDHSLEAGDLGLFLANARDTVQRFRNHASIALWCGENEGVPSPARNEGLEELIRQLDGTRYYSPNSRRINLQASGPWKHGEPVEFFTERGKGFSTELGLPSVPSLDALRSMLPAADQWPPNDTWAYHDWHSDANGDVKPFMASMTAQFGAATSLEDFERKAQLMNYANHRAMFEGFNAHLWRPNSGRLMWMSHPAWPSLNWQLYGSDYDTYGSFFGVKKACEPVHVQLNLPDLRVAVINNTMEELAGLRLRTIVVSLDGRTLSDQTARLDVGTNTTRQGDALPALPAEPVFVQLELRDSGGTLLSENFYWQAAQPSSLLALNGMPRVRLQAAALQRRSNRKSTVSVTLSNPTPYVALHARVTLRHAAGGARVLPVYAEDNYVSLLPGGRRTLALEYPAEAAGDAVQVELDGWNVERALIPISK